MAYNVIAEFDFYKKSTYKLSDSFKTSRIRVNCQEMRSYESNKCSHPVSDDTEPGSDGLSENRTPDLCRCRHNNTTTKNDRKLQIFTTENHLPITVLFCNVSDQLFKM